MDTARLYRSRCGLVFGVCRGMSDYSGLPVWWIRIGVLLATLLTAFWPALLVYAVAAFFMPLEPGVQSLERRFEHAFACREARAEATTASAKVRDRQASLDERLQNLEQTVTSRGYDWDARLNAGH